MNIEKIIDDSGDTMGYIVKGHINIGAFLAEITDKFDEYFTPHHWEHTVKRKVPCNWNDDWAFTYEDSEPGRGAFKCTIAWTSF